MSILKKPFCGLPLVEETFTLRVRTMGAAKEEVYESYEAARAAQKVAPFGSILSYKVKVPKEN